MKKSLLITGLIALSATAFSQNEMDALRYSLTQRPSTARSFGMGSSFGALGADLSSFFSNPAGVGAFKRSGFEFSIALHSHMNTASYAGQDAENNAARLTLNNFGIVANKKPQNSDWVAVNFGIAYAKTNNFYDNISIRGTEFSTTLMDLFAAQAAGINPDVITDELPFTSGLAYEVYAINPSDSLGTFYVPASSGGEVQQSKSITRSGSQSETSFAFGANYRDFMMLGMSIHFQGVRFREEGVYRESFESDQPIKDLSYREDLSADGTGVGVKLGVIFKPIDWLRVGAAYHSRTVISMRENYSTRMTSNEVNGTSHDWSSPLLITNYNLRTPARYMANAAFILGKSGVISADYEYADYENMRMRGIGSNSDYNYDAENETISTIYRGVHRVSAGMELRLVKAWYLRGGAIYQQSPFVNGVAINNPWITYTGGAGYRNDSFFIDLAAGYHSKDETYYLYNSPETNPATIRSNRLNLMLSLGFRY